MLIGIMKYLQVFKFLSEEQITGLRKNLLSLWSFNKFKNAIRIVNIQHLLTTPFMLEIVVQVLPTMTKKYRGSMKIKDIVRTNYQYLKKRAKIQKLNQINLVKQINQTKLNII
ncbi:unnamed protein product [Paramecium pentaurelia]|uniref:Uncharacterized protein n=1 Tax=Paramecium pentaurelia TaxID=43138 RepID=A0A8S1XFC7_9CILI|nr:unnamed protein product [Paramecium pentaurelia]